MPNGSKSGKLLPAESLKRLEVLIVQSNPADTLLTVEAFKAAGLASGLRCVSDGDTRCKSGPRNQLLAAGESANPVRDASEFATGNTENHRVAGTRRVID